MFNKLVQTLLVLVFSCIAMVSAQALFYDNTGKLVLNQTDLVVCKDVSGFSTAEISFVGNMIELFDDTACKGNVLAYVENNFVAGYQSANSWVHNVNSISFLPYFTSKF